MSIFNRHKGDDPWEMMSRQDVDGYCPRCKRNSIATKSSFRNGTIEFRAHCCNKIVDFQESGNNVNSPFAFPPQRGSDDDGTDQSGSGRYTKGKR